MIFKPEADQDVLEAVLWYEGRREGLGESFRSSLDKVLAQIERMPELYRVVYQDARRALTPGFPFAVYYRVDDSGVTILAVVHSSRNPESWKSRI